MMGGTTFPVIAFEPDPPRSGLLFSTLRKDFVSVEEYDAHFLVPFFDSGG